MSHHPEAGPVDRIADLEDLSLDLARRHKTTVSYGCTVDPAVVDADLAAVERDGYVILENLLSRAEWHGGGANHSGNDRLAITAQYCEPWLRPQEAFTLSTNRDTVRAVSEDIRRMLGYSVHPPFVGMVDGMHPKRLLHK